MKNLLKMTSLLAIVLVCMNSCDHDDPLGVWEKMKWTEPMPAGLVKTKSHVYQVPDTGGTYTIACRNYPAPWMADAETPDTVYFTHGKAHVIDGSFDWTVMYDEQDVDWNRLKGYWFDARFDKADLKVTFDALPDTVESRKLYLHVTAGDIYDGFTFEQIHTQY